MAKADKTILFAHPSHISCEKWSQYLGAYDKLDVTRNRNSGWWQGNNWGATAHQGQTETYIREAKIKPEQINQLQSGEGFIYDNTQGTLLQAFIE